MAAGKRSDPSKLRKEREAIIKDLESRISSPEGEVPKGKKNIIERLLDEYDKAVGRKQLRKNPPPVIRGAKVIGHRKGDTDA
jgi:hypothetical protein